MADTVKTVKVEYIRDELSLIDAIEALQKIGYSAREAESLVYSWDETEND